MAKLPLPEGLTNKDLECVMIDTPSLDIEEAYGEGYNFTDLYFSDHEQLQYAQGDVAAKGAHVTLLFGIHPSETYEEDVFAALDGWELPDILISEIDTFPSRMEGEDYTCLVAKVVPTAHLVSGHRRLQALPYSSNYDEYIPHLTLAYLNNTADIGEWKFRMQKAFNSRLLTPTGLNLGLDN